MQSDESMKARAAQMAQRALGLKMKVSLARHKHPGSTAAARTIEGPIVECAFSHFEYNGRTQSVIWKAVIEAGISKTRHVVHLKRLPIDSSDEVAMRSVRFLLAFAEQFERAGNIEQADALGASAANILAGVVHRQRPPRPLKERTS